ncbi:hypothetical protein Tco_1449135 [Tanacetum coccineum]
MYDALVVSLSVDEDDIDKELKEPPKTKFSLFYKKGTTPSKPSKPNKFVQAEETVKKLDQEVAINDEEPVVDEVVNDGEHPHDDDTPSQDRSKWFKQSPRPETFDPDWHKEPNADDMLDDGPEQMWFNDLVLVEKDPLIFDDLIDLEGPTFMLLKGTCGNQIELEYNFEQCHLALSDKLDWTNPEGDRCPFDMSKPLPLQGPPGHLIVPLDFFFNNDLEYLKI